MIEHSVVTVNRAVPMYAITAQLHVPVSYVLVMMQNHTRKIATGQVGHRSGWTAESATSLSLAASL